MKRDEKFGEYHSQREQEPLFSILVANPYLQAQKLARGMASSGANMVSFTQPREKKHLLLHFRDAKALHDTSLQSSLSTSCYYTYNLQIQHWQVILSGIIELLAKGFPSHLFSLKYLHGMMNYKMQSYQDLGKTYKCLSHLKVYRVSEQI